MKENNRNPKETHKKNVILTKKEIKMVNHILDYKKINKSYLLSNMKKSLGNKKPSPHKLEPIKVRLTPIDKKYNSKTNKNIIIKDSNINPNKNNKNNKSIYTSPSHGVKFGNENYTQIKYNKRNYTDSRCDIREEKMNKINRNCNTPYRRILNVKNREAYSPSTSVIIKNFNYNNVYNINIDNEKNKNKKLNKSNNRSVNKTLYNDNFNSNIDNESLSKYSSKDNFHKKFTYNKPKTTSGMNAPCILSKRNISKNIVLMNENNDRDLNKTNNMSETVYSRFITEGNTLKNCRNNVAFSNLISNISKLDNKNSKKAYNHTPSRTKSSYNFHSTAKKSYFNENNLIENQDINNNINKTYSNNFLSNNSYSNLKIYKNTPSNYYSISSLSLNNTFIKKNITGTPKIKKYYNTKTENILNKRCFGDNNIIIPFYLNDLAIFEDKINDIISAFNKTNNIYDIEASNECNELIVFYSKSSLKGIFPSFFKDNNKLIIESSINLTLFIISIIYNLSKNNLLFNDIIVTIKNILYSLKINFALYIKKIQLFYGLDFVKKNYIYFQPFNHFLKKNDIKEVEEEDDITYKIYQNCRSITCQIKLIMNYYQKVDINYYNFFIKIFNNISIQKENDLLNYFFTKISNINNSSNIITVNKTRSYNNINSNVYNNKLKKNRTNINLGNFSPYKKNALEQLSNKFENRVYKKTTMSPIRTENKETIKIEIPYIRTPSNKKYTLVIDLNKTLAYYNKDVQEIVYLRKDLFSFLSMIKPYYELIAFSCEPNEITEKIIEEIEAHKIYFDYKLYREHSILYENTLVKDISLIGRNASKIIIVDDDENCFKLNKENGIKISSYNGNNDKDNALFELKKILILIHKKNYDDVRVAIKDFSNDIKNKISLS